MTVEVDEEIIFLLYNLTLLGTFKRRPGPRAANIFALVKIQWSGISRDYERKKNLKRDMVVG